MVLRTFLGYSMQQSCKIFVEKHLINRWRWPCGTSSARPPASPSRASWAAPSSALKAYASTGELRSPEQRVEDAQRLRQEGFRALKLRFHSHDPRHDLRVLEAVRKAVGDGMDIMVDANYGWNIAPDRAVQRWDLRTAIYMARAMEELGVYWLEEPL